VSYYYYHYLLLLLLGEHLYSVQSLKMSNALHALCQYAANRKHLRQRLKESKGSVSSLRNSGRLFHADGPVQKNALLFTARIVVYKYCTDIFAPSFSSCPVVHFMAKPQSF